MVEREAMIWLLMGYVLLGAICATLWHSYKLIAAGQRPGGTVDGLLAARRAKKVLVLSVVAALVYALGIFVMDRLVGGIALAPYVVATPVVYLVVWVVGHLSGPRRGLR